MFLLLTERAFTASSCPAAFISRDCALILAASARAFSAAASAFADFTAASPFELGLPLPLGGERERRSDLEGLGGSV